MITVFNIVWGPLRSAEVRYWIDERLAGRGIMPTALAMAVDHCFLGMRLHRLEACIQPGNTASRRAVEKLGFRDEGTRVGQVYVDGAWRDHICYAITEDDVPDGALSRWRSSAASSTIQRLLVPRPRLEFTGRGGHRRSAGVSLERMSFPFRQPSADAAALRRLCRRSASGSR